MSKNEIARLRKHALHTGAADPIVEAFDAAHTDLTRKARLTRKKAAAAKKLQAKGKKKPARAVKSVKAVKPTVTIVVEPVVEIAPVEIAPVVELAPEPTPFETLMDGIAEAQTTPEPAAPVAVVPFARAWVSYMKTLPLSAEAQAALASVTARTFGKAVFATLPATVQAELVQVAADRIAARTAA